MISPNEWPNGYEAIEKTSWAHYPNIDDLNKLIHDLNALDNGERPLIEWDSSAVRALRQELKYENYDILVYELGGEKLKGIQKENYQKTMNFINTLPEDIKRNTEAIYENDKITLIALEPYIVSASIKGEEWNGLFMWTPYSESTDSEVIFDFNDITSINFSVNTISASTWNDDFEIKIINPNEPIDNTYFDTTGVENRVQWRKILEDIINNSEAFNHLSIEDKLSLLREFYPNEIVNSIPTYDESILDEILRGIYEDPEEFDLDDYLGPILNNKDI